MSNLNLKIENKDNEHIIFVEDLTYGLVYTTTIDENIIKLMEQKYVICQNNNKVTIESEYVKLDIPILKHCDIVTAKFNLYTINDCTYDCIFFDSIEFEKMHNFVVNFYFANEISKESFIDKINFIPHKIHLVINKFKHVDLHSSEFVLFLSVFLSYFSYEYYANIRDVNIDTMQNNVCIVIFYYKIQHKNIFDNYVMCSLYDTIFPKFPKGFDAIKNKHGIVVTQIYNNGPFLYNFYAYKKSRIVINNYF